MRRNLLIILLLSILFTLYLCADKRATERTPVIEASSNKLVCSEDSIVDSLTFYKRLHILANGDTTGRWPVKQKPALQGSILPYKRVVAYYGNLYSKRMGVLGQYPPKEMWKKLNAEVETWQKADPSTPVQPAIHYIALVAQSDSSRYANYCFRMPDSQIDSALSIAEIGDAILFLDLQIGRSTVMREVPRLKRYLKMPHVHLAVDPEFSMKDNTLPGQKIGYMTAVDVNYCIHYLTTLVKQHDLPPKILIVHRFTQGMLKNYKDIVLQPEVQVVINMDGWGQPSLKYSTYRDYIYREPIQFTGFKLFYKNDLKKPPHRLLTPAEILKLKPQPIYIQYQ